MADGYLVLCIKAMIHNQHSELHQVIKTYPFPYFVSSKVKIAEITTKFVLISGEKVTSSVSKSLFTVTLVLRNLTASRVTALIGQHLIDGKQSLQ